MTLEELKQVKADVANGVIVSKQTWLNVLEQAIKLQQKEDEYQKLAAQEKPKKVSPSYQHPNDPQLYPRGMEPVQQDSLGFFGNFFEGLSRYKR